MYKPGSKNLIAWLFILPVVLLLYACPYSSAFKIDSEPAIPIENAFLGKWSAITADENGKSLSIKMSFDRKNDFEYNINFTGDVQVLKRYINIENDSIRTSGFISEVGSRRFLNLHLFEQYYLVELIYKDDKLTLLPLCEHFTSRLIKKDAEIRLSLEQHYKTRLYPLYDDEFCLRDMKRIE